MRLETAVRMNSRIGPLPVSPPEHQQFNGKILETEQGGNRSRTGRFGGERCGLFLLVFLLKELGRFLFVEDPLASMISFDHSLQ